MKGTRDFASMSNPSRNGQFSRRWTEPQHIGPIAHKVMVNVAVRAVEHWLQQADALKGKDCMVCLETADAILCTAGLTWGDVLPRRAA